MLAFFSVDPEGNVCISILHEPGDDKYGYEKASERWLPIHTVETILVSVISMIADPNDESPANVDAAVSISTILKQSFRTLVLSFFISFEYFFYILVKMNTTQLHFSLILFCHLYMARDNKSLKPQ